MGAGSLKKKKIVPHGARYRQADPHRRYTPTAQHLLKTQDPSLKHSHSASTSIEGTHAVTHDTDVNHMFELRDAKKNPIIQLSVSHPIKGEL